MDKYVSICPNCGRVYRHFVDKSQNCFEHSCIGIQTIFSRYTEQEWDALNDAQRQETVEAVKNGSIEKNESTTATDSSTYNTKPIHESNLWISLLNTVVNINIFLGTLAALVVGIVLMSDVGAGLGLAVVVIGVILCLLLSSAIKVFLGLAKDVHYLRNSEEKRNQS